MTVKSKKARKTFFNKVSSSERPLLFISYFAGIRGNCPAEWADDKIRVLEAEGRETLVLTGMGSHVTNRRCIRFVTAPSLSWNDYREEARELREEGERVPLRMHLFKPLACVFGSIIDYILFKITKGMSAGRWSWVIAALPVALWLKLRYGARDVFCTGGPTSAHLLGGIIVRLTGGRLFCEFQDPLLGATMTRSSITQRISENIEQWLVKRSTRAIYVTKEAARLARERNPVCALQIVGIYPGAWQFVEPMPTEERGNGKVFEFLHLGTLYGSRNLDLFFDALDSLSAEGFEHAKSVRVVNLGAVYCHSALNYQKRNDFKSLSALERSDALERARCASCLLLIQHTDERSKETIPYKTYDYLNLKLPVFGLLNNDELGYLINAHKGYTSQASDVESIKIKLRQCLLDLAEGKFNMQDAEEPPDISQQFLRLF